MAGRTKDKDLRTNTGRAAEEEAARTAEREKQAAGGGGAKKRQAAEDGQRQKKEAEEEERRKLATGGKPADYPGGRNTGVEKGEPHPPKAHPPGPSGG